MEEAAGNIYQSFIVKICRPALIILMLAAGMMFAGSYGREIKAQHPASFGPTAQAILHNPEGREVGMVLFKETGDGVKINVVITDMQPGKHALHIHEKGVCLAPDFKSAGGHFNPYNTKHGFLNPKGPHAGDLPNFTVNENDKADFSLTLKRITLMEGEPNGLFKKGGTSVVIHRKPDDYITDPAGRGGARIACGVIEKME